MTDLRKKKLRARNVSWRKEFDMAKGTPSTKEQILNIVKLNRTGLSFTDIANLLNMSESYIGRVCRIGNLALMGDIQAIAEKLFSQPELAHVSKVCCEAFGVDYAAVEKKLVQLKASLTPDLEKAVKNVPQPVTDNTALFMVQILSEIKQLNENLLALMDADLPKRFEQIVNAIDSMAHDVEQVVNSNCDVLNKELQVQTLALDKIRKGNRNG